MWLVAIAIWNMSGILGRRCTKNCEKFQTIISLFLNVEIGHIILIYFGVGGFYNEKRQFLFLKASFKAITKHNIGKISWQIEALKQTCTYAVWSIKHYLISFWWFSVHAYVCMVTLSSREDAQRIGFYLTLSKHNQLRLRRI